jgi:hypothetical protein
MTDSHGQRLDAAREKHFLEELRRHPELMERFEAILALTKADRCVLRSADETEELLVEEMRRLGLRSAEHADLLRRRVPFGRGNRTALGPLCARCGVGAGKSHPCRSRRSRVDRDKDSGDLRRSG